MKSLLNKFKTQLYIVTLLVLGNAACLFAGVQINGVPPAYASIQNALDNAFDGDTLIVSTGLYEESVNIFDRNITIDGGYNGDYATKAGTGGSIIDGVWPGGLSAPGSIIDITNSNVRLIDLSITDGGFSIIALAGYGGGLDIQAGSCVTAETCHIYDNKCKGYGGGIYVKNSSLFLENSSVENNIAYSGLGISKGGGIYVTNGNIYITGNTADCKDNYAQNGGGIAANDTDLTINDSADIVGNTALYTGGGILLENNSYALISGISTIIGVGSSPMKNQNSVTNGSGGGLYASDSSIVLSNRAGFWKNFASENGGAAYLINSSMIIDNAAIGYEHSSRTNYARLCGGGVYAVGSTLTVKNGGKIFRGFANDSGGGVFAESSTILFENATLGHSNPDFGNVVNGAGGGLFAGNCSSVFENAEIINNQANDEGGGLEFSNDNYFLATDSQIFGNSADFGGGIDFYNTVGCITIDSCSISNNVAYERGGGIMVGMKNTLNSRGNSKIIHNTAGDKGGGISLYEGAAVDIFSESPDETIISDNVATNFGGGIYGFSGSAISGEGSILFRGNHAKFGGGICISNNCLLDIFPKNNSAAVFIENNAVFAGGGLFAMGTNVIANVKNVNFGLEGAGNSVTSGFSMSTGGGGAYISDGALFDAVNCSFIDNASSNYGGAIYVSYNSTVNIKSDFATATSLPPNNFFNNHSYIGGAIVEYMNCDLNISDATIISNSAVNATAGIVASQFCTAQFVNVIFAQNSSPAYAAAFVGITNYYVSFKNCTIADNFSNAVMSFTTPFIEMENCIVWGNSGEIMMTNCIVQYSDIQGGYPGTGNITNNPMFVNPNALDYQLAAGSECIDKGVTIPSIINDCIDNPRPMGLGYDMGAYELDPTPILNISPLELNFGDVVVGGDADLPVTVENIGNSSLDGDVINTMIPIFSIQSGSPYSVSPFMTNTVTFRFSPIAEVSITNIVTFQSNGGNTNVMLTGTGIPEPSLFLILLLIPPFLKGVRGI